MTTATATEPGIVTKELAKLEERRLMVLGLIDAARDAEDFKRERAEVSPAYVSICSIFGQVEVTIHGKPDEAVRFFADRGYALKRPPEKTANGGLGKVLWDFGRIKLELYLGDKPAEGVKCRVEQRGTRTVELPVWEVVCDDSVPEGSAVA